MGPDVTNIYSLVKVPVISDLSGSSQFISQAHCGKDFTLLLNLKGEILSAGKGEFNIHCNIPNQFDLGRNLNYDKYQFSVIPVSKFGGYPITFVAAGEEHCAVINEKGELWTWGLNSSG